MSKSKEELDALKKEYEELNEKCRELTLEELEQVTGGIEYNGFKWNPLFVDNTASSAGGAYIDGHDHIGYFSSGRVE